MTVQIWRAILFALGIVIVFGTILATSNIYNTCLSNYQSALEYEKTHGQARSDLLICIHPIPLEIFDSGRARFMVHELTGGGASFPLLIGSMLILTAFFLPRSTETYTVESSGDGDTENAIPAIRSNRRLKQKPKQSAFVRAVEIGAALAAIVGAVVTIMSFLKE